MTAAEWQRLELELELELERFCLGCRRCCQLHCPVEFESV